MCDKFKLKKTSNLFFRQFTQTLSTEKDFNEYFYFNYYSLKYKYVESNTKIAAFSTKLEFFVPFSPHCKKRKISLSDITACNKLS